MPITIKEFVNELSKSDLMEHPLTNCNLSCLFQGHTINIIPSFNGYNVVTKDGSISLGSSLVDAGTRIVDYIDIKNNRGIMEKLEDHLLNYSHCRIDKGTINFRGTLLTLEDESIVARTVSGDKFYFNIANNTLDLKLLAEKINRFLK